MYSYRKDRFVEYVTFQITHVILIPNQSLCNYSKMKDSDLSFLRISLGLRKGLHTKSKIMFMLFLSTEKINHFRLIHYVLQTMFDPYLP